MDKPISSGHKLMLVREIRDIAADTKLMFLSPCERRPIEPAQAGAHIDVHLTNGMVRQYSLITGLEPYDDGYAIAIKRDRRGRGGSDFLHTDVAAGSTLSISGPRNNFPLADSAPHSVLIAGGIGITPIWSMMHALAAKNRSFELHYAVKSRADALFLDHLDHRNGVTIHVDEEAGGLLDVGAVCAAASPESHLYCCGPAPMLSAFRLATSSRASDKVHLESFAGTNEIARNGGFEIELSRTGVILTVKSGKSILDTIRDAGLEVVASCEQGVCGACETVILEGVPDHRCEVLSAEQRAEGHSMMICCSGAKTSRLVLDL